MIRESSSVSCTSLRDFSPDLIWEVRWKSEERNTQGHHTVTPSLTLDNAAPAIDWYKKASVREENRRVRSAGGKIMTRKLALAIR